MILVYVLLGALILALPDDSESFTIPLPIEVFHEGYVQYSFHFDDELSRRYLKPGEILPEAAIGTLTCYSDRYASTRLLDSFQEVWEQLTPRGLLAINHQMALIAQEICDDKWEELHGPAIKQSLPSWYP